MRPSGSGRGWLRVALVATGTMLCSGATAVAMDVAGGFEKTSNPGSLVVCADPNNLPFSNRNGEGFENALAALIAHDLGLQLRYLWWAQRRGFARNTLSQEACDLWPGVADGVERMATTRPYYRSTYVFVSRARDGLIGLTLDDERLRSLSIGVQMIGNDAMNTPPAHAVARRGLVDNVRGFMLYGDYAQPNPPAAIIQAVERGEIEVALAWGPMAGYFAAKSPVPLRLEPITPALDGPAGPMTYGIAVGVRRDEPALRDQIDQVLTQERDAIALLLRRFHVPVVETPSLDD
jgi:mxaJ protein